MGPLSDLIISVTTKEVVTKHRVLLLEKAYQNLSGKSNMKQKNALENILHKFKFLRPGLVSKVSNEALPEH